MSLEQIHYTTFKQGSRTYFNSSLFFPKAVRRDVFALYGFVRVADNFVDSVPQDPDGFHRFKEAYRKARENGKIGDPIIDAFIELDRRKGFDPVWTEAFLHSMELDLKKKEYNRLEETLEYIYGSAEVIGLYMAKLLDLVPDSYPHAERLGRSMQYINFIRDIDEDRTLGRRYLPLADTPLKSLDREYVQSHPGEFNEFLRHHLDMYRTWQREAEAGFRFIPRRYLIPIKTASDMYNWTARTIEAEPMVVFRKKIKPSKLRIWGTVLANLLGLGPR
ncbi:MAG: phytoene/squalene synthase family protein [Spirochaetaceae bacterium]|nr:MAG: phytoene/squalene synthase family protein [Spirochaetaceae bacterium]